MWLLIHTHTHTHTPPTPQVQINGINYDHGLADYLTPGFHYLLIVWSWSRYLFIFIFIFFNSPSSFILYKFHNHGICIDIVDFFFPVFKTDIKDSHKNSLY